MNKLLIGTRGSPLAIAQANIALESLNRIVPDLEKEMVLIKTTGDKIQDRPLTDIGGKELFIKEIHQQLFDGSVHIGVHSLKDIPGIHPDDVVIAAMLEREDPRDILVSRGNVPIDTLPKGATIGTSSPRRKSQILNLRPDLNVVSARGRVQTRIQLVDDGKMDAVILAYAGLKRVSLEHRVAQVFSVQEMIPAVGQGIIAIDCLRQNDDIVQLIRQINHFETSLCAEAERSFLQTIQGNCHTPIAGYAFLEGSQLILMAYYHPDHAKAVYCMDTIFVHGDHTTQLQLAKNLGADVAQKVIAQSVSNCGD